MVTQAAEQAVRAYLESVLNPNFVSERQAELEQELENESDVLKIVELKQAIRDERQGTTLKKDFIKHAKSWADDKGIEAVTLQEMNVPWSVLQEAGFTLPTAAKRASSSGDGRKSSGKKRVSSEDVERSIRNHRKGSMLSVPDLVEKTGASSATVTKALKGLVGDAVKDGVPDPDHDGRGRAPLLYERI